MKALMIDDDRNAVETVSLALQIRLPEAELVSTHLGQTGIEMVKRETPDIVILDLGLPDMDGFEVLRQVRSFSDVPVIVLTVWGEENDVVRGLALGANDYIVKPFSQAELLARIRVLALRRNAT